MILPRRLAFLVLAALAAFATAADTADSDVPYHKTSRAMKQWQEKKQKTVAALVEKTRAAGHSSQLRAMATVAADSYQSGMAYYWAENECTGNSWAAEYYGSSCAKFEEGMSMRFDCTVDGDVGQIQAYGFANGDCSGTPAVVLPLGEFPVGECFDGVRVECSADLKYGMDNAVVYGSYASSKCKSNSLYSASLYPYGCDGYGYKETCVDGELVSQSFPTDDCSGTPDWEGRSSVGVCELYEADDDNDGFLEVTSYTMNHCSSSDVDFTGSSDSAPIAGFSWAAILMTAFAAFAMRA